MTSSLPESISCPTCGKETRRQDHLFYPFCCERCKMIDLGRWFDGKYHIEGSDSPPESAEP